MFPSRHLLLAAALGLSSGCGASEKPMMGRPGPADAALPLDASAPDASPGSSPDADGEDAGSFIADPACGFVSGKLDLLFVVDNSISMQTEQALLARELPRMVRALASGDVDGDGKQDHPAGDLHIGVVSTDMGLSGDHDRSGTDCSRFGDDGLLRNPATCPPAPGGYLAIAPSEASAALDGISEALGCQIQLGTRGCGMEQQLEATLKAVAPGVGPLRFTQGTLGHGDGANAGFLREDATLAIVIITDEDDCSYPESSRGFANTRDDGPYADVPINYRCQAMPELLHPITRYTESLPALRGGAPGSVVFGLIAGIPAELTDGAHDIDEMLSDPAMQFEMDEHTKSPRPACTYTRTEGDSHEAVLATPARRLLEVAKAFGEHTVLGSICEPSFERPVAALAKRIGGVLACPDDPIIF
jgi:hypothetical protein